LSNYIFLLLVPEQPRALSASGGRRELAGTKMGHRSTSVLEVGWRMERKMWRKASERTEEEERREIGKNS